jgi:hypothetical protein
MQSARTTEASAALPMLIDVSKVLKGAIKDLKPSKALKAKAPSPCKAKKKKKKKKATAKASKPKVYKIYRDGRLLAGETGYCAWCRSSFLCTRNYSKPQYFCQPSCKQTWQNHYLTLRLAEYNKTHNMRLPDGQKKVLQIEAERRMHGVHLSSGLHQSDLVRMKPIKGGEKIMGCERKEEKRKEYKEEKEEN